MTVQEVINELLKVEDKSLPCDFYSNNFGGEDVVSISSDGITVTFEGSLQ